MDSNGYREVLGIAEGGKEDHVSWLSFLRQLKARDLKGVRLIISDKCLGLIEALGEVFPKAQWQRCTVHFYRNVFSLVPRGKIQEVAAMLKAIHSQEDYEAALEKAQAVVQKLKTMKLTKASTLVKDGIHETLRYYAFPSPHWRHLRTNNPLERIIKEIRRRTRVVGAFPDGQSALMASAARLRHRVSTKWSNHRYMDMYHLLEREEKKVHVS